MVDDTELIKECESQIWNIIARMHREGVRYEVVYFMLSEMVKTLEIQTYCEEWLGKWNKPDG